MTCNFLIPPHTENERQLGILEEGWQETYRWSGHRWVGLGLKGGVTGYLDVLFHFALECTISGMGSQSEARFQAMLVRPGAMDHLP